MDPYNPFFALIVAGGSGTRMGSDIPKQFMEISGVPMIIHTLRPFASISEIHEIILVLPSEHLEVGRTLTDQHFPGKKIQICEGGITRTESVRRGLKELPDDGIVAIHDGARPLVTQGLILRSLQDASEFGAAVPIVHVRDTVRKMSGNDSEVVDREMLRLVQTPQAFSLRIIKDAYERADDKNFTDDAAVISEAGYRFQFFEGDLYNLKVTTPEDLVLASAILSGKNN